MRNAVLPLVSLKQRFHPYMRLLLGDKEENESVGLKQCLKLLGDAGKAPANDSGAGHLSDVCPADAKTCCKVH